MKKSLVALAALSALGSAFADIDISGGVKMYGVLDQGLTSQNVTKNGTSLYYQGLYASSATSRLGFKGTRDLGNGLKGEFQIEQEIWADAATTMPSKNRGTFVGLSGKGGTLRLGTQETTAYETFNFDVNGRIEYKPQVWRYTASASAQDRANNAIKYISPELAGFSIHGMMNFAENASNVTASSAFTSVGAKFQNSDKKFKANLLVDQITVQDLSYILPGTQNVTLTGATSTGTTITIAEFSVTSSSSASNSALVRTVGAMSYDFENIYVSYIYAKAAIGSIRSISTNTFGVRIPYDNFKFGLSYGNGSISSDTTAAADGTTVTDTTFGAYYNFDKSTSAYFLYSNSTWSYQSSSSVTSALGVRYNF